MPKPLGAGSEIDAWCTKCRMDLGHRIVAMVESKPRRVECQTCGSQHNYRPPRSAPAPKAGRPARPAPGQSAPAPSPAATRTASRVKAEAERLNTWEGRVLGQAATAFTRFSIDRTFAEGQLVLHKKFGEGYVVAVLEDGKVSIMFRDGARTLVHGQPPTAG